MQISLQTSTHTSTPSQHTLTNILTSTTNSLTHSHIKFEAKKDKTHTVVLCWCVISALAPIFAHPHTHPHICKFLCKHPHTHPHLINSQWSVQNPRPHLLTHLHPARHTLPHTHKRDVTIFSQREKERTRTVLNFYFFPIIFVSMSVWKC